MAAAHHGQPCQRENDGADDADGEEWRLRGGRCGGLAVFLRGERVVGDGEGFALFDVSG